MAALAARQRGGDRLRRTLAGWALLGLAAFALLPWYLTGERSFVDAIRTEFSAPEAASGLRAATGLGKPWLGSALAGLTLCAAACLARGALRGWLACAGAALGLGGVLVGGWAIGATGWSASWMDTAFGPRASGQAGIGWGA